MPRAKREYYKRLDPLSFYTAKKFKQRYRLTKEIVRLLIKHFVSTLDKDKRVVMGPHAISHRLRFCIALRYYATGSNYSVIGDCHGVSSPTVSRAVRDVSNFFSDCIQDYVHWPGTFNEKAKKALKFYKKGKVGRIFGLIDGTHIPIACPYDDEELYFCRKGYYSINAMVISDADDIIMHIDVAYPGSANDIYVLNGSEVCDQGDDGDLYPFCLLGDSGYPLRTYLLTPYKTEDTPEKALYNTWHKKTRSQVERTIGILKQRWRCLDSSGGYLFHSPFRAGTIIEACVCLHNVARAGQVKIYKDFPAPDSFKPVRKAVEQPKNSLRGTPVQEMRDFRDEFVASNFVNYAEETSDTESSSDE